ncbi:hypothetical protein LXL04_023129 [Taraxacum kok-saghyz]
MMASSSSSSSYHCAFSSQPWKYHAFLSFRGEDTSKTFVDHLYLALEQQGIYTYKEDKSLPRGILIGPSLMKAIEESHIAIIIFSKNYVDSSWCLAELSHIMKCRDMSGQIVMPIFYDVDPSEVRRQKRKYEEAFAELENKTMVEFWRKALVDASNISESEPNHIAKGHESKVIKEIVYKISHMLQPPTSSVMCMIEIWGAGDGGKTTLHVLKQKQIEVNDVQEGRCLMNYWFDMEICRGESIPSH